MTAVDKDQMEKAWLYGMAESHWRGPLGDGIRALLFLEKCSGSFLWFWETAVKEGWDRDRPLTAGYVARCMMHYRLNYFDDNTLGGDPLWNDIDIAEPKYHSQRWLMEGEK